MKQFVLFFLMGGFLCNISFSQYENDLKTINYTLFGGLMIPQGDFGNTDSQKAGYAKTGIGSEFEINYMLDPTIYWTTTAAISINSVDEDELAQQMKQILPSDVTVKAGNYTTVWALSGLNLETKTLSGITIYGVGKVGLLLSSVPNIDISFNGSTIKQTTEMGFALAIGFGAGVKVNKFNFGIRYYTGEPEYKQEANYEGIVTTAKVKLPATLLSLMIGYNF